jgi:site-specific DNA-cytosine methylase
MDLLAGGVPYPSFTIAGNKLGARYERDLFAWAIELGGTLQPRALMLENVRGLSLLRFAAYRQHVRDLLLDPPGRLLECPESVIRTSRPIRNVRTLSPAALMVIRRPGYLRKRVSEGS